MSSTLVVCRPSDRCHRSSLRLNTVRPSLSPDRNSKQRRILLIHASLARQSNRTEQKRKKETDQPQGNTNHSARDDFSNEGKQNPEHAFEDIIDLTAHHLDLINRSSSSSSSRTEFNLDPQDVLTASTWVKFSPKYAFLIKLDIFMCCCKF